MVQNKAHFVLGAVLFLTVGVSTTLGYVPEPQLWFDAKDNPNHPEGWTNLGIAGKKLVANDKGVPVLEPHAGPDGGPAYTAKEEGQSYGRNAWGIRHPEITPAPRIESWTIEVWLKRDGPAFDNAEHQILGIMDTPHGYSALAQAIGGNKSEKSSGYVLHGIFHGNHLYYWSQSGGYGYKP